MPIDSNSEEVLELVIDSHEGELIKCLESEQLKKECGHVDFYIEQLEVGDIIFRMSSGDKKKICFIERKTNGDYAASITDGRLKNQSLRIAQLRKENPDIIIIYLIEGPFLNKDHRFPNGITRDSLYSSIINKVVRDRYIIYRTANPTDTALFVGKLYDKLPEHINPLKGENKDERLEYLKTIKLSKKENMTPENCYLCQLSQIPGVSIDMANLVAKLYPSLRDLILTYERMTEIENKENLLANIMIPIANDKQRKLGKIISKRIYQYLCNVTEKKMKIKIQLKN